MTLDPINPAAVIVVSQARRRDWKASASFEAEQMETFELGWRGQLGSTASIDISLYRSLYDKLRYGTFGAPSSFCRSSEDTAR